MHIVTRDIPPRAAWALEQSGIHPLLAQLFAARGIAHADELDTALTRLLPPDTLLGCQAAAVQLAHNTLVLVNGRRMILTPGTQTENFVPVQTANTNAIPVGATRRIEVLRDGAAAIYGADAVAGGRIEDGGQPGRYREHRVGKKRKRNR